MAILAALTITYLFSGSALSKISYPDCTKRGFSWSYNSLNQNPCAVAAFLQATCNNGEWSIGPLPTGYHYVGPGMHRRANLCRCNTVVYSLVSACGACQAQGDPWHTWDEWAFNCTQTLPPSTFPNPIPDGTCVPHWALLDITLENDWNLEKSKTAGDSPEISPGVLISASSTSTALSETSTSTVFPATSTSPSPTATPSPASPSGSSSPNTGFIVVGVVGGIAVITIAVVVIFFLRRLRARAPCDAESIATEGTAPSEVGGASLPTNQGRNGPSHVTQGPPATSWTPQLRWWSMTRIMPPRFQSFKIQMLRTSLFKHLDSTRRQYIPLLKCASRSHKDIAPLPESDFHSLSFTSEPSHGSRLWKKANLPSVFASSRKSYPPEI